MTSRLHNASLLWKFVFAVFVVMAGPCSAEQPYTPVYGDALREPWRWRTFPELSGLDVQCMVEGPDGRLWFGTANDLWSYDGLDWVRHASGVGHLVTALCRGPDGTLYSGGGGGIGVYRDRKWERWLPLAADARIASIEDIPVRDLACGLDGSVWATTTWGALHRTNGGWTIHTDPETAAVVRANPTLTSVRIELFPEAVTARLSDGAGNKRRCDVTEVCPDRQGRIWIGTAGGQVLVYTPSAANSESGAWSVYDEADGVLRGSVSSILPLEDDSVWVVHADTDLANIYNGQSWTSVRLPLYLPPLDLADVGGKLMQTSDGVVWLSARYALFAYRDGYWRKYMQPDPQYPSTRNVVMQSANGALWFSGPNSEICRIDYETPRWVTLEDLNFQWESDTGTQWFLHRDGRIVVQDRNRWRSLGAEDGLIDTPVNILGTRRGVVWVTGSHDGTAATARFEDGRWTREVHGDFSFAIDWRSAFESSDGSVWFGAFVDTDGPAHHRDGILQYRNGAWIHHHQSGRSPRPDGAENPATLLPAVGHPDRPIEKYVSLGESRDGRIWAGRNILAFYDGTKWTRFPADGPMRFSNLETMLTTREGDLWLGTRETGAWRYDGRHWQQFQGKDSLPANSVRSLAQTADGSIWAVTDRGTSRFDGLTWMSDVLPAPLHFPHESGDLRASPSGHLWINRYTLYWMRRAWAKSPRPLPDADFRTVSHHFRGEPPRTSISAGATTISQPGNLAVLWSAQARWRDSKLARLQFSWRLDGGPWSAFTSDRGHSFFALPDGEHRLEVRARDADFNIDPVPAVFEFVVLPPVWRQGWFILLMVVLGGLIVAQTVRVLLEKARLRRAHDDLEVRVRQRTAELEAANRDLQAFSYSVSHDLRAPLRSIDGFSRALLKDYGDKLDDEAKGDLQRVRAAAQRMGQLIDDMLKLSRVTRAGLRNAPVNLSTLAEEVLAELAQREPERKVNVSVAPNVMASGDANLLRIALGNLLGNAWKFSGKRETASIEFGVVQQAGEPVYFVRDNGAGFEMTYVHKLFGAFNRLHSANEFPGTGVGLAIVHRVIMRHGGRIWAEAKEDAGATFFFTLAPRLERPADNSG